MPSKKAEEQVYVEIDGKVYLVKDGGMLRFPHIGENLPFEIEKTAKMNLTGKEILMARPLLDYYPEEWLGRDDALERDDVDSVVKNAIYMTMMRVVSELAIVKDDKVLMVKAKRGFSEGYWNLPGGFVQYGETPKVAGARETSEETGVEVEVDDLVGAYVSTFPNKPTYTLGFVYGGKALSTNFKPKSDEIEKVGWQTFDNALELTKNPFAKWGIVDLFRRLPEKQMGIEVHRQGLLESQGRSKRRGPGVLLDRDGVINRSVPGYLKTWREFEFLPGSIEAMKSLCEAGFRLAIVTNQDVMGWKIVNHKGLRAIHAKMINELKKNGVRIEEIYYCPHNIVRQCRCHKPKPAMLLVAARDLGITPRQAWMVGDKVSDIVVGKRFGCWTIWIADKKRQNRFRADARKAKPDFVCEDLRSAAEVMHETDMDSVIYRAVEL